jgi:hypothetical protein
LAARWVEHGSDLGSTKGVNFGEKFRILEGASAEMLDTIFGSVIRESIPLVGPYGVKVFSLVPVY